MVVVEGGLKTIKGFKKLMMQRIKWNADYGAPKNVEAFEQQESQLMNDVEQETNGDVDMETDRWRARKHSGPNRCLLVWEGILESRHFQGFRTHRCPTDGIVRERLAHVKDAVSYWDLVRNINMEEKALLAPDMVAL